MSPQIENMLVRASALLFVIVGACDNGTAPAPSAPAAGAPAMAAAPRAGAPSSPAAAAPPAAAVPPSAAPPLTHAAGAAASAAGAGGTAAGAPAPSDRGGSAGAAAGSAAPMAAEEEFDPEDLFPPLSTPETRTPSPDNPAECPMTAPEDPVGDCLGLPVYLNCVYGTYNCVCDWYHWLCFG